jgi:hypothetical protein
MIHAIGHWFAIAAFLALLVVVGVGWLFWRFLCWVFNRD